MIYAPGKFGPAADVEEARAIYSEKLLAEAYRRGVDGWVERGLYINGRRVGDVKKYSDKLLLHLLRRYDPEYREDVQVIMQERVERVDTVEVTEAVVRQVRPGASPAARGAGPAGRARRARRRAAGRRGAAPRRGADTRGG